MEIWREWRVECEMVRRRVNKIEMNREVKRDR
jgi:hypothetical protein